jgi:hypothetical protein
MGGLDFALKLLDWHQQLPSPRPEAAVLRKGLVFDHHRRNAGRSIARHEISDVDRIAVSGIDIGDDRRILHLSAAASDSPAERVGAGMKRWGRRGPRPTMVVEVTQDETVHGTDRILAGNHKLRELFHLVYVGCTEAYHVY